jgi:hypothetical protein
MRDTPRSATSRPPSLDTPLLEETTIEIPTPIVEDSNETFQAPTQHPIAAVNWTGWNYRVYLQNNGRATNGAIYEAKQEEGKWSASSSLFAAKRHTPLAAVCRDNGKEVSIHSTHLHTQLIPSFPDNQIRVYYLNSQDTIQEQRYKEGQGWYPGTLNRHSIETAPYSRIAATAWANGIRVYYQGK